jgi:hypothetical protein
MIELIEKNGENCLEFEYADVDRDRDAIIETTGQPATYWISRIDAHLRRMLETNSTQSSLLPRFATLIGLKRLLAGEPMKAEDSLVTAATFISCFMRLWRLADESERKALKGQLRDCFKDDAKFQRYLFEWLVGIVYARWGNRAMYNDLASGPNEFDWKIFGKLGQVQVEAKSTSWQTKTPVDRRELQSCVRVAHEFISDAPTSEFEGFIRITYTKSAAAVDVAAVTNLSALLSQTGIMRSTIGEWSIEYIPKQDGYNQRFRDEFHILKRERFGEGCDIVVFNHDKLTPICGIAFVGEWDHAQAILQNLETAFGQLRNASRSVIWVQMSGMPSHQATVRRDFEIITNTPQFRRRFSELAGRAYHGGFICAHFALDLMWWFGSSSMRVGLPNAVFGAPQRSETRARNIAGRIRQYQQAMASLDGRVGKGSLLVYPDNPFRTSA